MNGIANVSQEIKISPDKGETHIPCPSTNKVKDLALKFGVKNSSTSSDTLLPTKNSKSPKTSLNEKPKLVVVAKKENTKAKVNNLHFKHAILL